MTIGFVQKSPLPYGLKSTMDIIRWDQATSLPRLPLLPQSGCQRASFPYGESKRFIVRRMKAVKRVDLYGANSERLRNVAGSRQALKRLLALRTKVMRI